MLDRQGLNDVTVHAHLLADRAAAATVPFAGSPTILIDGVDQFPGARTSDLACRVFVTPEGLAGSPSTAQVEEAIGTALTNAAMRGRPAAAFKV